MRDVVIRDLWKARAEKLEKEKDTLKTKFEEAQDKLEKEKDQLKTNYEKAQEKLNKAKTIIKTNEYVHTEANFKKETLNKMQITCVTKYTKESIFPKAKLVNNAFLKAHPHILDNLFKQLQMSKLSEQVLYRDSVVHWLKHSLTQKRRYIKDRLHDAAKRKFELHLISDISIPIFLSSNCSFLVTRLL